MRFSLYILEELHGGVAPTYKRDLDPQRRRDRSCFLSRNSISQDEDVVRSFDGVIPGKYIVHSLARKMRHARKTSLMSLTHARAARHKPPMSRGRSRLATFSVTESQLLLLGLLTRSNPIPPFLSIHQRSSRLVVFEVH